MTKKSNRASKNYFSKKKVSDDLAQKDSAKNVQKIKSNKGEEPGSELNKEV